MKAIVGLIAALAFGQLAGAADIYVRNAKVGQELSDSDARKTTEAIRDIVSNSSDHTLAKTQAGADFALFPVLQKSGDQYVLRIEKLQNGRIVSTTQTRLDSLENIRTVARPIVDDAITSQASNDSSMGSRSSATNDLNNTVGNEQMHHGMAPSARVDRRGLLTDRTPVSRKADTTRSAATQEAPTIENAPSAGTSSGIAPARPRIMGQEGHWNLAAGPELGVNLGTNNVLYGLNAGYVVPFTQRFDGKVFGEAALGSGSDVARVFNVGIGTNIGFGTSVVTKGKPYIDADLGYAWVRDNSDTSNNGVSLGTGVGYQFAATNSTDLDVLLRYDFVSATVANSNPSVIGARLGINF